MPVTGADEAHVPRMELHLRQPAIGMLDARTARPVLAGPAWDLLQGVLDEAFEAVHNARLRSQESAEALEDHKRQIAELEARCERLQIEHDNVHRDVAVQQDEIERLTAALADHAARVDGGSPETAQKQAKLFYGYLNDIAGVITSSERQMTAIRAHYAGEQINQADMIEELNFARSETLARIGRILQSLTDRARSST
jgi:chromosome segregation ATPase